MKSSIYFFLVRRLIRIKLYLQLAAIHTEYWIIICQARAIRSSRLPGKEKGEMLGRMAAKLN